MSELVLKVEFSFENLDWIRIPSQYFSNFHMSDVTTDIWIF